MSALGLGLGLGVSAGKPSTPSIWTPASISGLTLFLREQTGFVTAPASAISSVAPQFGTSIGASALQNGATAKPTLDGLNGAKFDQAGDDTLTLTTPISLGTGAWYYLGAGVQAADMTANWISLCHSSMFGFIGNLSGMSLFDDTGNGSLSGGDPPSGVILTRATCDGTGTCTLTWTGLGVEGGITGGGFGSFTFDGLGNSLSFPANDGNADNRHSGQILVAGHNIRGTSDETKLLEWVADNLNGAAL